MKQQTSTKYFKGVLGALAVLAMAAPAFSSMDAAQRDRGRSGGAQTRGAQAGGGQSHARREVVRTRNFVQRSGGSNYSRTPAPQRSARPTQAAPGGNARPGQQHPAQGNQPQAGRPQTIQGQPGHNDSRVGPTVTHHFGVQETPNRTTERRFTAGQSPRHYDNGLDLHAGARVTADWQRRYFPHGYAHFDHYAPAFGAGVFISPFGFYFGVADPFISASVCHVYPPTVMYVDVPLYNGSNAIGYPPDANGNLLNDPNLDTNWPGLTNAMDELTEAFQNGDIDAMATLVSPNVSIAVYEQGQYKYSMAANDYMDLTRDALENIHPVGFNITDIRQRSANVFSVSGEQTYTDTSGASRGVYMSFVLQDYGGQWTLTQVGTAPDRVQNF